MAWQTSSIFRREGASWGAGSACAAGRRLAGRGSKNTALRSHITHLVPLFRQAAATEELVFKQDKNIWPLWFQDTKMKMWASACVCAGCHEPTTSWKTLNFLAWAVWEQLVNKVLRVLIQSILMELIKRSCCPNCIPSLPGSVPEPELREDVAKGSVAVSLRHQPCCSAHLSVPPQRINIYKWCVSSNVINYLQSSQR